MNFSSRSERSSGGEKKPHRLFIVEDEILVAMDLRTRLTDMGYLVVGIASTGIAAIEAVYQHQADLFLMDIHLSGDMDGIAAAKEIHQSAHIPIVFMTAYADEETIQRSLAQQPSVFLSKLSDNNELSAAIEQALAKKECVLEKSLLESSADGSMGRHAYPIPSSDSIVLPLTLPEASTVPLQTPDPP